jgi:hypothetical protein
MCGQKENKNKILYRHAPTILGVKALFHETGNSYEKLNAALRKVLAQQRSTLQRKYHLCIPFLGIARP